MPHNRSVTLFKPGGGADYVQHITASPPPRFKKLSTPQRAWIVLTAGMTRIFYPHFGNGSVNNRAYDLNSGLLKCLYGQANFGFKKYHTVTINITPP